VHDAILIEAPDDDVAHATETMRARMEAASRDVLGGPTVRVDASAPLRFPARYVDGRNAELWELTLRLLQQVRSAAA
jgi:hypothetical protein